MTTTKKTTIKANETTNKAANSLSVSDILEGVRSGTISVESAEEALDLLHSKDIDNARQSDGGGCVY